MIFFILSAWQMGCQTGFTFALQFFMLISAGLGGVIFWEGNKNSSTLDLKDQNSRSNLSNIKWVMFLKNVWSSQNIYELYCNKLKQEIKRIDWVNWKINYFFVISCFKICSKLLQSVDILLQKYRISSYSFRPWIVSAPVWIKGRSTQG